MKLRLIKITPIGHDPEFMVVTDGSTAHMMVKDYAKDNAYPIEDTPCNHRFKCILRDLEMIERTIEKNAPFILDMPALMENGKPFNEQLRQSFSNIEIACHEESDEVEHEWLQPDEKSTYEQYTKGWSLSDKLKWLYDEDTSRARSWTTEELAEAIKDPEYFTFETNSNLKQVMLERDYIKEEEE